MRPYEYSLALQSLTVVSANNEMWVKLQNMDTLPVSGAEQRCSEYLSWLRTITSNGRGDRAGTRSKPGTVPQLTSSPACIFLVIIFSMIVILLEFG